MAFLGTFNVHDAAKITVEIVASRSGVARWYRIAVDNITLAVVFHANGTTSGELPELIVRAPFEQEVAA